MGVFAPAELDYREEGQRENGYELRFRKFSPVLISLEFVHFRVPRISSAYSSRLPGTKISNDPRD
jgi:hypothetical protein